MTPAHLPPDRLAADDPTPLEAEHLAACAACRVEARRLREFLAETDPDEPLGDALPDEDRYEDLGFLGAGGMGEVRRVRDRVLDRVVAMKLVRADAGEGSSLSGTFGPTRHLLLEGELTRRFLREVHVTARLQHPAIVPVYDLGRHRGRLCYTMKLVSGQTLAQALACGPPPRLDLVPAFATLCHALAYAHANGVVHRDLKPGNVMLGEFGETVVLDWGLARVEGLADLPGAGARAVLEPGATRWGAVLGTEGYMSPEQAAGEVIDARSDVYALGVILRELLTGRGAVAHGPAAPADLAAIAAKATAARPEDRYADAGALATDVDAWRDGGRVGAHRYTTRELVARFVGHHRAATATALAAGLALLVGGLFAYVEVIGERDAALVAERKATARALWASMQNRKHERRPEEAFALLRASAELDPEVDRLRVLATAESLVDQGALVRLLHGQEDFGSTLAISPDGTELAGGVGNGTVVRFDVASGQPIATLRGPPDFVWYVKYAPGGHDLVVVSGACTVEVWDLAGNQRRWGASCGDGKPTGVTVSDDGALVAVGSATGAGVLSGGDVRVWTLADGVAVAELPRAAAHHLSFLPGTRRLLGSHPEGAAIWEPTREDPVQVLRGIPPATSVAAHPDGRWLAAASDHEIAVWVPGGALLRHIPFTESAVGSLQVSPDGRWLGWGTMTDRCGMVELPDGTPHVVDPGEGRALWTVFHPTRDLALTGGTNHIVLWDLRAQGRVGTYLANGDLWYRGLVWATDGSWFAYSGGTKEVAVVTPFVDAADIPLGGAGAAVIDAVWAPDRSVLYSGDRRFDGRTGAELPPLPDGDSIGVVGADGAGIYLRGMDGLVHLHEAGTDALRWEYRWPRRIILRIVQRSRTGLLAVGGFDPVLRVLDERDGREVAALAHDEEVFAAAWSPTGELATGTNAGKIVRWSPDWTPRATSELGERVEDLTFSSDGSVLLVNGATRVAAFDAAGEPFPLPGVSERYHAAVAADAPWLVTLEGTTPRVWHLPDLAPGPALAPAPAPPGGVGISADGRRVTARMTYGTLVWDRESGALRGLEGYSEEAPGFSTGLGTGQGWLQRRGVLDEAWFARVSALNGFAVCRDTWEVVPVDTPGTVWASAEACAAR